MSLGREGFGVLPEKKADVNDQDKNGRTLVHYAAAPDKSGYLQLLLYKKADLNIKERHLGFTPLHILLFLGENSPIGSLEKVAQILLEAKANPNEQNDRGDTPLHMAVRDNHSLDMVQLLLQHNASPTIENKHHESPRGMAWRKVGDPKLAEETRRIAFRYHLMFASCKEQPQEEPTEQLELEGEAPKPFGSS